MLTEYEAAELAKSERLSKAACSPAPTRPKGFKHTVYTIFYRVFFTVERLLGAPAVFLIMRAIALIDLSRRWKQLPQFVALRTAAPKSFWQGVSARQHYRKMIFDWHEYMGLSLLYGRLSQPYWRERITVRGKTPFDRPGWAQRPVIIALMHTGGYALIRTWLRSRGIKAVLYVGGLPPILDQDAFHDNEEAAADRAYGLEGVPGYFRSSHSLRDLMRFLKPGNVLVMAVDGGAPSPDSDRQETGDFPIFVKKGICRMGAQVNALVVPASVKRTGVCRLEMRFGEPVPEEILAQDDPTEATHHVVQELWRDIKADPGDLVWSALESFPPTAEERKRVIDDRPRTWP